MSSTEAARDTSACPETPVDCGSGSYDLAIGRLGSGADSGPYENSSASASVETHDGFRVIGIEPGTPVSFAARLTLSGSSFNHAEFSNGYFTARIREGTSNEQTTQAFDHLDQTIEVTVQSLVGDVFQLALLVTAAHGAGGSAGVGGTLSFAGLPEGATIVSCHGYSSDPVVPVRRTTWGALKATYR